MELVLLQLLAQQEQAQQVDLVLGQYPQVNQPLDFLVHQESQLQEVGSAVTPGSFEAESTGESACWASGNSRSPQNVRCIAGRIIGWIFTLLRRTIG